MAYFAIKVVKVVAWANLAVGVLVGLWCFLNSQYTAPRMVGDINLGPETTTSPVLLLAGLGSFLAGLSVWAFFITIAFIADNVSAPEPDYTVETFPSTTPLRYVPIPANARYRPTR
jgi:hypothetical protein